MNKRLEARKDLVAVLKDGNPVTRRASAPVGEIGRCTGPPLHNLDTGVDGRVVCVLRTDLKDPDLMTGDVSDVDRVLLGVDRSPRRCTEGVFVLLLSQALRRSEQYQPCDKRQYEDGGERVAISRYHCCSSPVNPQPLRCFVLYEPETGSNPPLADLISPV